MYVGNKNPFFSYRVIIGSSSSVNINIREGSFGLIPVPENVLKQGEDGIEQQINRAALLAICQE